MLGHLTATAKKTQAGFIGGFLASGFRFHVMSAKDVARETAGSPQETLADFLCCLHDPLPGGYHRFSVPGSGLAGFDRR